MRANRTQNVAEIWVAIIKDHVFIMVHFLNELH